MKTPVALIIFKRPETTKRVFEAIRQAQPTQLLVVADGARPDRPGEAKKCAETRAIIDSIDWKCDLLTNYADHNLGCRARVSSGLDWVFQTVEEAIILEDDCLPHPTFFRFCEELLDRYFDDKRVMSVCGDNARVTTQRTDYSYYYAQSTPVWGWATWRRAWEHYDVNMQLWPTIKAGSWCQDILSDPKIAKEWERIFQAVHDGLIDTWDYQWTFACWTQNAVSVIANTNLISNQGFHADATHTKEFNPCLANRPIGAMEFPLKHPPFLIRDMQAEFSHYHFDYHISLALRAKRKLRRMFNQFVQPTLTTSV